jgi:hypothetical protein
MKKPTLFLRFVVFLMLSATAFAQTAGTLTFTYTQPTPTSPAATGGGNVYAVWIETAAGNFVKTKCRYVSGSTDDHLPTWGSKSGCANSLAVAATSGCNTTDAATGTTRKSTTTPTAFGAKTVTWDGKNVVGTTNGTTVADGDYKIWVESSWNDGANNIHNELIGFTFTKGPVEQTLTPAGDTRVNTVTLHWLPAPLAVNQNEAPAVTLFPVPSTGVFTIALKNEVNAIRVFDLLGKTVYQQDINPSMLNNQSVAVDLSHLSDGNYVISLQNEFGVSNYEVILKK